MTTTRDAASDEMREKQARELLAHAYEERIGEGPYPSYANLARSDKAGDFTKCSIRAIERALAQAAAPMADELESHKRMLGEACHDLGLIHEALGLDPDEAGGAAPILEAIAALLSAPSVPAQQLDEGKIIAAVQKACGEYRTNASYSFEDVWNCIEAAFALAAAPSASAQAVPTATGDAEADRIIGRLMSSDPEFDDCADAADMIRKLLRDKRDLSAELAALVKTDSSTAQPEQHRALSEEQREAFNILKELSLWKSGMTTWRDEPQGPYLEDIVQDARALLSTLNGGKHE